MQLPNIDMTARKMAAALGVVCPTNWMKHKITSRHPKLQQHHVQQRHLFLHVVMQLCFTGVLVYNVEDR
jgi:hypothetical protein